MSVPLHVIITGATGMVGEGVLLECLNSAGVASVLIINRKPAGISHPKLKEIVHADFFDISTLRERLKGYNACFFCLGVSSVGMNEEAYHHVTYTLTLSFARTLAELNPDMVFCYVSGAGTDSSEKGKVMWARVKGKTENDLMKLPFRKAYAFRPGFMKPVTGQKNVKSLYWIIGWMYPALRALFPGFASTLAEVGQAMIAVATVGYSKPVLEVKDIVRLAGETK